MDAVNKENAPKTGRKHRILAVILPLAAFVLELLPLGAVLRFGHMQTETGSVIYRLQGYSYFDLMLPGYGNFGPFIAGLLTTLTLIFAGIYALFERKWLLYVCTALSAAAAAASLMPLFLSAGLYNAISFAVTALLVGHAFCMAARAVSMRKREAAAQGKAVAEK